MFPRPGILMDYPEDERIFFGGKNLELPQVLNSLTMILAVCEEAARSLLLRPWGAIFSPIYIPNKPGMFIIWLTLFKYERSSKQTSLIHDTART